MEPEMLVEELREVWAREVQETLPNSQATLNMGFGLEMMKVDRLDRIEDQLARIARALEDQADEESQPDVDFTGT